MEQLNCYTPGFCADHPTSYKQFQSDSILEFWWPCNRPLNFTPKWQRPVAPKQDPIAGEGDSPPSTGLHGRPMCADRVFKLDRNRKQLRSAILDPDILIVNSRGGHIERAP